MIKAARLYPVNLTSRGKLFLPARPRGGEWLEDEVVDWKTQDIDVVVSLLTKPEEVELDLKGERDEVERQGLRFISLPMDDRQVPSSRIQLISLIENMRDVLNDGKNVVLHCRQGVGRTGLVAACLLIRAGMKPTAALALLASARGAAVPDTLEQKTWIEQFD